MGSDNIKPAVMYIDQLTWLRGFAAFFVIITHVLRATEVKYVELDEPSNYFLYTFFDMGNFGVVLFFVLSGCTLYISNANKVKRNDILHFYVKRFFRIWPAFAVSIIFYIGFGFIFEYLYTVEPQGYWLEKQFLAGYSFYDVLIYLTLVFNITGPGGLFNNAYWSLPVEFQYYLIFPVIVYSLHKTGVIGPIVIGMVLFVFSKINVFNFDKDSVFSLAYSFCGGVLIGYFYMKYSFRLKQLISYIMLVLIVVIVSAINHGYIALPDIPIISDVRNWFVFLGLLSTFIVLFTKFDINLKIELVLKYYGTISYSTYLYHNMLIAMAVLGLIYFEIYDANLRFLVVFIFTMVASYMLAGLSYKYIEVPSIKIGRTILNKNSK